MANMIKMGAYEIDESLYKSPMITRKWFQNNQCLLAYNGSKTLDLNGNMFYNTNGFHIKFDESIEISYTAGNRVKVNLDRANKIAITRESSVIKIKSI